MKGLMPSTAHQRMLDKEVAAALFADRRRRLRTVAHPAARLSVFYILLAPYGDATSNQPGSQNPADVPQYALTRHDVR